MWTVGTIAVEAEATMQLTASITPDVPSLLRVVTAPEPIIDAGFGLSVHHLGQDRFIAGAPTENAGGVQSAGAAYLFDSAGTYLSTFTNPTPEASDRFGETLAALGSDRIVIGAERDNPGGLSNAGSVYLYDTNAQLIATFSDPTPTATNYFGAAIAGVGSDHIAIGAPYKNGGADRSGMTYLFDTNGVVQTVFTNPSPSFQDLFGDSITSVGDDKVLVGAWLGPTLWPAWGLGAPFCTPQTEPFSLHLPTGIRRPMSTSAVP